VESFKKANLSLKKLGESRDFHKG